MGGRRELTPLLETHMMSEAWSNMRMANGRVRFQAASSMSGGGAPPAMKGPFKGVAEGRMRVGTLLGKVTKVVVMVEVAVVVCVMLFRMGVAVLVMEEMPLLMVVRMGMM